MIKDLFKISDQININEVEKIYSNNFEKIIYEFLNLQSEWVYNAYNVYKDIDKYLNIEHFGSTFLKDCNKASLNFHEISKDVNKPTNNSASLIQQI